MTLKHVVVGCSTPVRHRSHPCAHHMRFCLAHPVWWRTVPQQQQQSTGSKTLATRPLVAVAVLVWVWVRVCLYLCWMWTQVLFFGTALATPDPRCSLGLCSASARLVE